MKKLLFILICTLLISCSEPKEETYNYYKIEFYEVVPNVTPISRTLYTKWGKVVVNSHRKVYRLRSCKKGNIIYSSPYPLVITSQEKITKHEYDIAD